MLRPGYRTWANQRKNYMPIFAVSRRNDETGALLAISADDASHAVTQVEDREDLGALFVRGYHDASDGYTASPADEDQKAKWIASLQTARDEGGVSDEDDADWFVLLRPPEFVPDIEEDDDREDAA